MSQTASLKEPRPQMARSLAYRGISGDVLLVESFVISTAFGDTGVALRIAKNRTHFEIVLAYKTMRFMIPFSYRYVIVVYFFICLLSLSRLPISLMLFVWPCLNS